MSEDHRSYSQKSKLFVANLPQDITNEELRKLFERYGVLGECAITKKPEQTKVFAFVKFDSHANAAKAKEDLDGHEIRGRRLSIKWALPRSTVWVGDLEPYVTNETLKEAFSEFGSIESAIVVTDPFLKKSKGYGFVSFSNRQHARKALSMCQDGLFLIGPSFRPVRVDIAEHTDEEEGLKEKEVGRVAAANPRFASPGSLEYDFALKWRELSIAHKMEEEAIKEKHKGEVHQLWKMQEEAARKAWMEQEEVGRRRRMEESQRLQRANEISRLLQQQRQMEQQMAFLTNNMPLPNNMMGGMNMPGMGNPIHGMPGGMGNPMPQMGGGMGNMPGMGNPMPPMGNFNQGMPSMPNVAPLPNQYGGMQGPMMDGMGGPVRHGRDMHDFRDSRSFPDSRDFRDRREIVQQNVRNFSPPVAQKRSYSATQAAPNSYRGNRSAPYPTHPRR